MSFTRLPDELINHIMSYARRPQPRRLLRDIEHFTSSWILLKNTYNQIWMDLLGEPEPEHEMHLWIQNDIIRHVNENQPTRVIFTENYYEYWRRLKYTVTTDDILKNIYDRILTSGGETEAEITARMASISKTMWGLLLPHERCSFFSTIVGDPGSPTPP